MREKQAGGVLSYKFVHSVYVIDIRLMELDILA